MEFLQFIVDAITLAHILVVITPMVVGLILLIMAAARKKAVLCLPAVLLIALPFTVHSWRQQAAERTYAARVEQVANMVREPLPDIVPRLFYSEGQLPNGARELLVLGYFDEVQEADNRSFPGTSLRRAPVQDGCAEIAARSLVRISQGNGRLIELDPCLLREEYNIAEPSEAIVMRRDHNAKNRTDTGNTVWLNGIVELVLLTGGRETLIDYQEYPHVETPGEMFSPMGDVIEGSAPDATDVLLDALRSRVRELPLEQGAPQL